LLLGPVEYSRMYQDQLNSVLRLYFSQIDAQSSALLENVGGRFLGSPHGSFYDTTTQSDGINTPNAVQFNSTVAENTIGISVGNDLSNNPTRITTAYKGQYNFQFSFQLENTSNAQHEVGVWARINGVDVPNTNTVITVPARKSASIYGYAVAAWNLVFTMEVDDYLELMWATNSTSVTIPYIPAWTSITPSTPYIRPATPSAIMTVSFLSSVPA